MAIKAIQSPQFDKMIELIPELHEAARACRFLSQWGWSEASGGNLSLRLESVPGQVQELTGSSPRPLPITCPQLAGLYFLVSGTGTRARDIAINPGEGMELLRVLPGGESYVHLAGNDRPTMELPSHFAIHAALTEVRPEHRAIVHTHPPNLIALTHLAEFEDPEALNEILGLQSEARIHLPEGLAVLPFHVPGSLELGLDSARAVRRHTVVLWYLHGALATGVDFSNALDYLEVVDKAARIYWILRAAGVEPGGMTEEDLRKSLQHFGCYERYLESFNPE